MPVNVYRPGPWTHRDLSAGGTRFHAALAGPESPLNDAEGTGPLVVLLHGFPECWWTWRHVMPALA
ncbi:MAG: Alpha/beta family hydrolase, partial [Actinomyces urogenitalis DORA_12]